jgi:hypothetical protein
MIGEMRRRGSSNTLIIKDIQYTAKTIMALGLHSSVQFSFPQDREKPTEAKSGAK